jgi:hypothetical protein
MKTAACSILTIRSAGLASHYQQCPAGIPRCQSKFGRNAVRLMDRSLVNRLLFTDAPLMINRLLAESTRFTSTV